MLVGLVAIHLLGHDQSQKPHEPPRDVLKLVRVFDCSVTALLHPKPSMADESLDAMFFRGSLTSKLQKQTPVHCCPVCGLACGTSNHVLGPVLSVEIVRASERSCFFRSHSHSPGCAYEGGAAPRPRPKPPRLEKVSVKSPNLEPCIRPPGVLCRRPLTTAG